ncbi:sugar phosphate isomerase/epimerase family protein [Tautonia rosea]|uniref:sugar phosphate isomerase/epimerase family protein n=1 Tax=Tautonia rosea TaxID=2728037 RepID=UPI001474C4E2|nr:TIM barrel protein [Tautonia rosea]
MSIDDLRGIEAGRSKVKLNIMPPCARRIEQHVSARSNAMSPSLSLRMLGLRFDALSAIELSAQFGFRGVELLIRDLIEQNSDLETLASRMADLGLRAGSWPLPVDWRGDEDRFRRDLSQLPSFARVASQLGLDRTGTWVLPEVLDPDVIERDQPGDAAIAWHLDRLGPIAKILNDHGHRLGLEAIGVASFRTGRGFRFIDRLEALRPLLGALRDQGCDVGLIVDSFHLYAAGESVEIVRRFEPDEVISVHLSDVLDSATDGLESLRDNQRSLPTAEGPVPNRSLLRILSECRYDGPVYPEPVVGGGLRQAMGDEVADWKQVVQNAAEALDAIWPTDSQVNPEERSQGPTEMEADH